MITEVVTVETATQAEGWRAGWRGVGRIRRIGRATDGRLVRWWVVGVLAWCAGAVGGVAPAAFLGDPAPGVLASALLGAAAVAYLSPVLVLGVIASVVADDDRLGLAAVMHVAGVSVRARVVGRGLAGARTSLVLVAVGAAGGLVSAAGLAARSSDPFSWGLRSAPSPGGLLAGVVILSGSWVVAVVVAVAAVTPARVVVVLAVAFAATGVVASFVYFVPALRPLLWCSPAAAVWPFDAESFNSAQFAVSIPIGVRVASALAWTAVAALVAWRRLVLQPYPPTGEPEARRSRRRSSR